MTNPVVSIVIICYNGAQYLYNCFDSLLKQTYKNLEIIIVNDGSTDNSLEIMNSYIQKFNNNGMKLIICSRENGGMSAALNSGLKLVTGHFFMWCDCDDYYEPDAVESLLKYLNDNPDIDIVRGKCRFIDYESKKVLRIKGPKDTITLDAFDSLLFQTDAYCNTGINMTSVSYLDKCIKDREIYINRAGQNWQLLLPFAYYGNFGFLDKVVYNYNIISASDSHSKKSIYKEFNRWNNHKLILYNVIDSLDGMQCFDKIEYKNRIDKHYRKKKVKLLRDRIKGKIRKATIRTHVICDYYKCTGCGACYNTCPHNSITMIENKEGFKFPSIDKEKCTDCGLCTKVCPVLTEESHKKEVFAYACNNKNEGERRNSSSGGVFILLAKEIIKQGGVVFGACFDSEFRVIHDYADSEEGLAKFMTSKYVQSDLKDSFKRVKDFLDNNRLVYFSGTPCQVEGLRAFLGKEYDNLVLQDIICHGVPSPKAWEKYKNYRLKIDSEIPRSINFRNKDNGWNDFNTCFEYGSKNYKARHNDDLFMKAFLKNTCLRASCYNCSFKVKYRNSDITLGDFWGLNKVVPSMNDDQGTSAVVINSIKGKNLYDRIKNDLNDLEVSLNSIISGNSAYVKSSNEDCGRAKFFQELDKLPFDRLVKKYVGKKQNIIKRIIRKVL